MIRQTHPVSTRLLAFEHWLCITALLGCCFILSACQDDTSPAMIGTLERDRIELSVESNEPLSIIHVEDGQSLSKGTIVLEQDMTRHRVQLAQQVALRDQSAARLAELRRGPRPESIAEAEARLTGAQARTNNAKREFERELTLFERELSDAARRDRLQANYDTAVAQEQVDRQALEALLNGTTVEELQQAEAAFRSAQAAVDQAQLDLNRLSIVAPVDGVVDKVWYETGERPRIGETVAVMLDDARPYARIYVPAEWRQLVQPGQTLTIQLDGVQSTLSGTVRWVSADASFTPYFALTEYDRSRLSYLAEVDVPDAAQWPSGLPLVASLPTAVTP